MRNYHAKNSDNTDYQCIIEENVPTPVSLKLLEDLEITFSFIYTSIATLFTERCLLITSYCSLLSQPLSSVYNAIDAVCDCRGVFPISVESK